VNIELFNQDLTPYFFIWEENSMRAIFIPDNDQEMIDNFHQISYFQKSSVYPNAFIGGTGQLGSIKVTDRLTILCHGHGKLPLFVTHAGRWTAAQLAQLLVNDHLALAHREIELWVCHAGESIGTKQVVDKRFKQRDKLKQKVQQGKMSEKEASAKWDEFAQKGGAPKDFLTEQQVLPLAAEFTQAMKDRGFDYIRVIAYRSAVAQIYHEQDTVYLDSRHRGGQYGTKATEGDRVVWL
jgi:hypothetical protein